MGNLRKASRREALGLMSAGMAVAATVPTITAPAKSQAHVASRPGREKLDRLVRLYGGEFGGGRRGG